MIRLISILPTILASGVGPAQDGFEPPIDRVWPSVRAILYAVVLTAVICLSAFKNARRTYLD